MIYNETKAVEEIKGLSDDARYHLQDLYRNFLNVVHGSLETYCESSSYRCRRNIFEAAQDMAEKLRRLGL
jgi:hypothetical protein